MIQLTATLTQLTGEVKRLAADNMQGFQKTRGNIRDLNNTLHEGLEALKKDNAFTSSQEKIANLERDKALVDLIGTKHADHRGSFLGCTICLEEWTRLETILRELN